MMGYDAGRLEGALIPTSRKRVAGHVAALLRRGRDWRTAAGLAGTRAVRRVYVARVCGLEEPRNSRERRLRSTERERSGRRHYRTADRVVTVARRLAASEPAAGWCALGGPGEESGSGA